VPWRFLDACQLSVARPSLLPASKNLHNSRLSTSLPQDRGSRPDAALVEITKFHKLPRTADPSYRQRMIEDSHLGKQCGLIPIEMLMSHFAVFKLNDGGQDELGSSTRGSYTAIECVKRITISSTIRYRRRSVKWR
jgi:hypothetical protein